MHLYFTSLFYIYILHPYFTSVFYNYICIYFHIQFRLGLGTLWVTTLIAGAQCDTRFISKAQSQQSHTHMWPWANRTAIINSVPFLIVKKLYINWRLHAVYGYALLPSTIWYNLIYLCADAMTQTPPASLLHIITSTELTSHYHIYIYYQIYWLVTAIG